MDEQKIKLLIGLKIRNYRRKLNLTQEQLCSRLNIDISGYSNIENGKSSPLTETLCKIMDELKINPCDLFDFMEDKISEESINDKIILESIKSLTPKNRDKVLEFIELLKK